MASLILIRHNYSGVTKKIPVKIVNIIVLVLHGSVVV